MAGAAGGPQQQQQQQPQPQQQQQRVACQVFPERRAQGGSGQGLLSSVFSNDQGCQRLLLKTLQTNPYVKLLLDAMKHSGCAVNKERHFSCEDCNGNVSGGFDASTSQIVLCQNNIRNQAHMNRVVTHELVHAFDHCRAHVNWFTDVRHLACSEVRAANLSGDCSLVNEIFRLHFGLKRHHQTCVRDRAILSILAVRNISKEVAQKAVDEVFESCFNDQELLEGSHITRLMQDMHIETFKIVIGITQIYEDNDILYYGASVIMKKIWFLSGQTYKI